jgi:hypothetical protein
MAHTINYILLADGNVAMPRLEVAIFEEEDVKAMRAAADRIRYLVLAGFYRFTLFNCKADKDVEVESYRVKTAQPEVTGSVSGLFDERD